MESVSALFPFALILVVFYLLIIRPTRSRQRAALALQQQIAPGLEVMTTSGMYGRVGAVDEDSVSLEVSPGTSIRFAKAAIARILTEEDQGSSDPQRPDESAR